MCPQSLRSGVCSSQECKLKHIKGTKRKHEKEKAPRERKPTAPGTDKKDKASTNADFLEMIKTLKEDLLAAVDAKMSAFAKTPPAGHHPQMPVSFPMAPMQTGLPGGYPMYMRVPPPGL